jgi:hypothetical protein
MTILEKANQILADKEANLLPENLRNEVTCLGVNGKLIELVGEEKAVIATTEEQEITPSEGFNGITKVIVRPVTNTIDGNIKPENIKSGEIILGVEGSYTGEAGVKTFNSVEELNNSTENKELDLAMVNTTKFINSVVDSEFSKAKFPETVTLQSAITDELISFNYNAVDDSGAEYFGELSASGFDFQGSIGETELYITYESTDGMTYTRTDGGEETIDFSTAIKFANAEDWNDGVGCFVQLESIVNDVYQYIDSTWTKLVPEATEPDENEGGAMGPSIGLDDGETGEE